MSQRKIILDFGEIVLEVELFDNIISEKFFNSLPYEIQLETWGNECYGSIGIDLGTDNPVPIIPGGGVAYTNRGNYLCIFYGQNPAWPVEHIGKIKGEWQQLIDKDLKSVSVKNSIF